MNIEKLNIGKNLPNEFNVIIEIPANSAPVKYEMDKDSGALMVDRFPSAGMSYPVNYGFIPHTLSEDGDPTDVLVITPFPVVHGAVINCRPLGILNMEDESGFDAKILAVPTKKICPLYSNVETIAHIPELLIQQISYFFEHYKGMEKGKWVKVGSWGDIDAAKAEITNSVTRYNKQ